MKKKILIVDDDKDFVTAQKDLLEESGYQVDAAHDGTAGLEKARKFKPNLMILDVMMAHESEGFDISRKIAAAPELKGIPVIIVTGIRREMKLPFAFEPNETWLPVKAVLEKPVEPEVLLREIKKNIA